MKFSAFFLLVIVAVAQGVSLVEELQPLLNKVEKIPLLLQNARSNLPLRYALGRPEAKELDFVETEIRQAIGYQVSGYIKDRLLEIQDTAENPKPATTLSEFIKSQPTRFTAIRFIDEMNGWEYDEFELTEYFNDSLSGDTVKTSLSTSFVGNFWNKIKNLASDVGDWASGGYKSFKAWLSNVYDKVIDASKPIVNQVKILAVAFLKQNWERLSVKLVKQAIAFFTPFDPELGGDIMAQLIKLAKQKGLVPWENKFY